MEIERTKDRKTAFLHTRPILAGTAHVPGRTMGKCGHSMCVLSPPLLLNCLEQAIGLMQDSPSLVAQGKMSTKKEKSQVNQFEGKISSVTSVLTVVYWLHG